MARDRGGRVVAVTEIDGWNPIVEPVGAGAAGSLADRRLSRGTVLVEHHHNEPADPEAGFGGAAQGRTPDA